MQRTLNLATRLTRMALAATAATAMLFIAFPQTASAGGSFGWNQRGYVPYQGMHYHGRPGFGGFYGGGYRGYGYNGPSAYRPYRYNNDCGRRGYSGYRQNNRYNSYRPNGGRVYGFTIRPRR